MAKKRTLASALAEIDAAPGIDANELLTAADRDAIREKARAHVRAKKKAELEKIALEGAIADEERAFQVAEDYEFVLIDLAPFVANEKLKASCITLDGTIYSQGQTYEVPYSVARTLEDVMARTWEHENEIHGLRRKQDTYRRPLLPHIGAGQEHSPVSALNKRSNVTRVGA